MSDNTDARRALLLDNDLFFSVKITDTLKHAGYQTRTVRRLDDFTQALVEARPLVALVNTAARGLDWRSAITAARAAPGPLGAFGAPVDIATQQEAPAPGAPTVVATSKLAQALP